jgi:hypothetical protein
MNKFLPEFFNIKYFLIFITGIVLIGLWTISEKIFMKLVFFTSYHLLIFGTIWWFGNTYLSPFFTEWAIKDWFRNFLVFLAKITLWVTFVWSVLSCFSSKKLKKAQIGQWSFSEWMPDWGKNEENSFYGLFLGLPEWMVEVTAIDKFSKPITETQQIQIEEYTSTGVVTGRKFAADFKFSFPYEVVDTRIHILRPNGDKDLTNLSVAKITEWLNDGNVNKKYENVAKLKAAKNSIQEDLVESLEEDSSRMYGDKIGPFIIISIEDPEETISQQNRDAAARAAQIAEDERELINIANFRKKVEDHIKFARKKKQTLTWTQAAEEIFVLEGISKSEIKKFKGKMPNGFIDGNI